MKQYPKFKAAVCHIAPVYFDAEACARSALGSHRRSTGSIAVYWHGNEDEAPTRIEENQVRSGLAAGGRWIRTLGPI